MVSKTMMFICQAVDENEPLLASTINWIRGFAQKSEIEKVTVLTLRKGSFDLPDNVTVYKIQGNNKLARTINFYKLVLKKIRQTNYFFIYMGGVYPVLLLPFKLFMGKLIYQWKAHPHISLAMSFYAYFCDTKIFTSTANAFPLKLSKVMVIGQGIDTERFDIKKTTKTGDMILLGRITPVKRLEKAIEALAYCNNHYDKFYSLHIYGPAFLDKDREYKNNLEVLIRKLGVTNFVKFCGPASYNKLTKILNRYRLLISFNKTALDRSTMEAMACGLPVITTNVCVEEILPEELKNLFIVSDNNIVEQAERINKFLTMDVQRLQEIGQRARDVVLRSHSLDSLVSKIIQYVK